VCRRRCWLWSQRVSLYWLFSTSLRNATSRSQMTACGGARPTAASPRARAPRHVRASRRHSARDLLTGVANCPSCDEESVSRLSDLERALYRTGPYGQVYYSITRDGIPLDTPVKVIPLPLDRSWRRDSASSASSISSSAFTSLPPLGAPRATHFYLFCLVSFAWYASSTQVGSTGLTGPSSGQHLAEALQPALFLHFALSFPEERFKKLGRGWLLPLIYAPALPCSGSGSGH